MLKYFSPRSLVQYAQYCIKLPSKWSYSIGTSTAYVILLSVNPTRPNPASRWTLLRSCRNTFCNAEYGIFRRNLGECISLNNLASSRIGLKSGTHTYKSGIPDDIVVAGKDVAKPPWCLTDFLNSLLKSASVKLHLYKTNVVSGVYMLFTNVAPLSMWLQPMSYLSCNAQRKAL